MYDLKVVIVGAGIGGLTAGIALKQAGYQVEMYDRARELRPVGAGISLWSNGVKVLNRLGLGREMAKIGGQMDMMQYRTKTGELLNHIDLLPLIEEVGQRPYPVARAELQAMLYEAYGDEVKTEHRCIGVEQDEHSVTAIFENGHRATGDLLIAADGVRSVVREYVLGRQVQPDYAGYINWNGLVPAALDLAPKQSWVIYVGEHKRASMMPVADDRFYFFFDVPLDKNTPATPDRYRDELFQHFQGWADPVQRLIERLDPNRTARLPIHDTRPFEQYVKGRVALLGDAAHATCPDLGQGGCQALEDAYVLMQYLMTTNISVPYALRRYEQDRKARANPVVEKARQRAEMIHGKDPAVTQQWYQQLAQESPADVTGALSKVILGGPLR
ncbi:MAG: FAD-dependent urate hydroxylase HpxO [Elainella sp.]